MHTLSIEAIVKDPEKAKHEWDSVRRAVTWPVVPRKGERIDLDLVDFPFGFKVRAVKHNFDLGEQRPLIVLTIHISQDVYDALKEDGGWSRNGYGDEFHCK